MKEEDILDSQIGNMGDEQHNELGKLQHVPGQQAELTESERESLDRFKSVTQGLHFTTDNNVRDGWIPIDRSLLGIRSQFYPDDWEFRVRPASTDAIKNWSSIEEENIATINNITVEILKTCVSIFSPSRGQISWDKINSWDKFWFVLKVREFTFSTGETALEFDEDCDNCGQSLHYVLNTDSLYYEFPDNEVVERHWDQNRMVWDIDPKEYDVAGRPVKFYTPTVGKDQAIVSWMVGQHELGKEVDEVFAKFVPYMLEFAPKDPKLLDRKIKDCYHEFKSWTVDQFLFFDEVRKNITINPSEKLNQKCPNCGEEVRSTVRFPMGIKYLFAVQGRHRKFGSK